MLCCQELSLGLHGDDGRLGLVDVPRVETKSVAEKVAVHRLALRRLPCEAAGENAHYGVRLPNLRNDEQ